MGTQVGVGFSRSTKSLSAGMEAAQAAFRQARLDHCDLVLLFCAGKHDPHEFLRGVRSVSGDAPVAGTMGCGVIVSQDLGYEGYEAGVAVFRSDTMRFMTFAQPNLPGNELQSGIGLGRQIMDARSADDRALLVFYPTIRNASPLSMNFGTPLFQGLEQVVKPFLSCAGAGGFADMQFSQDYVFFNDRASSTDAVAVVMSGDCQMDSCIVHGCRPASSYRTVTRVEGPVLYEIDGRPAVEVVDELLGRENAREWQDYALFVTLGVNKGDKFGEFKESDYANHLVMGVDREKKALIMFEPNLSVGQEVQLMRRSIDLKYVHDSIQAVEQAAAGRKLLFGLYIDCAGRAKGVCGESYEEATKVQDTIGRNVPLLGFYSGVEVSKVGEHMATLDWTGVLALISEPQ